MERIKLTKEKLTEINNAALFYQYEEENNTLHLYGKAEWVNEENNIDHSYFKFFSGNFLS